MLQIKGFLRRELVVKYFSAFLPKGILEVDFRILIAAGNLERQLLQSGRHTGHVGRLGPEEGSDLPYGLGQHQ